MSNTNLYTAKEIRQKYKISNQTLYNWRKANKIYCSSVWFLYVQRLF